MIARVFRIVRDVLYSRAPQPTFMLMKKIKYEKTKIIFISPKPLPGVLANLGVVELSSQVSQNQVKKAIREARGNSSEEELRSIARRVTAQLRHQKAVISTVILDTEMHRVLQQALQETLLEAGFQIGFLAVVRVVPPVKLLKQNSPSLF